MEEGLGPRAAPSVHPVRCGRAFLRASDPVLERQVLRVSPGESTKCNARGGREGGPRCHPRDSIIAVLGCLLLAHCSSGARQPFRVGLAMSARAEEARRLKSVTGRELKQLSIHQG